MIFGAGPRISSLECRLPGCYGVGWTRTPSQNANISRRLSVLAHANAPTAPSPQLPLPAGSAHSPDTRGSGSTPSKSIMCAAGQQPSRAARGRGRAVPRPAPVVNPAKPPVEAAAVTGVSQGATHTASTAPVPATTLPSSTSSTTSTLQNSQAAHKGQGSKRGVRKAGCGNSSGVRGGRTDRPAGSAADDTTTTFSPGLKRSSSGGSSTGGHHAGRGGHGTLGGTSPAAVSSAPHTTGSSAGGVPTAATRQAGGGVGCQHGTCLVKSSTQRFKSRGGAGKGRSSAHGNVRGSSSGCSSPTPTATTTPLTSTAATTDTSRTPTAPTPTAPTPTAPNPTATTTTPEALGALLDVPAPVAQSLLAHQPHLAALPPHHLHSQLLGVVRTLCVSMTEAVNGAARQPALLSTPHAALASATAAMAAALDVPQAVACAALARQPDLMHVHPRHLAPLCDALAAALRLSGSAGGRMPPRSPQHSPPAKFHSAQAEALQVLTRLPSWAWEHLTGLSGEARTALHIRVAELGHVVGCGGASIAAAMAARAPMLLVLPLPQVSDSWAVVKEVMGAGGAPTARVLAAVGRVPGLLAVPAHELRASASALSVALGLMPQHLARVALQQPGVLKCRTGELQAKLADMGAVLGLSRRDVVCMVRGAPGLLAVGAHTLGAKVAALSGLLGVLPTHVAQLVAVQPALLQHSPHTLAAKLMALGALLGEASGRGPLPLGHQALPQQGQQHTHQQHQDHRHQQPRQQYSPQQQDQPHLQQHHQHQQVPQHNRATNNPHHLARHQHLHHQHKHQHKHQQSRLGGSGTQASTRPSSQASCSTALQAQGTSSRGDSRSNSSSSCSPISLPARLVCVQPSLLTACPRTLAHKLTMLGDLLLLPPAGVVAQVAAQPALLAAPSAQVRQRALEVGEVLGVGRVAVAGLVARWPDALLGREGRAEALQRLRGSLDRMLACSRAARDAGGGKIGQVPKLERVDIVGPAQSPSSQHRVEDQDGSSDVTARERLLHILTNNIEALTEAFGGTDAAR